MSQIKQFVGVVKVVPYDCPCWTLKPGTLVKVKGWLPFAKVVSMNALDWTGHQICVRFETITAHEVEYRCHDLRAVCPLEELAKL